MMRSGTDLRRRPKFGKEHRAMGHRSRVAKNSDIKRVAYGGETK
jgi:hypothetical protein